VLLIGNRLISIEIQTLHQDGRFTLEPLSIIPYQTNNDAWHENAILKAIEVINDVVIRDPTIIRKFICDTEFQIKLTNVHRVQGIISPILNNMLPLPCYLHKLGIMLMNFKSSFMINNEEINVLRLENKYGEKNFEDDEYMATTMKCIFESITRKFRERKRANVRWLNNMAENGAFSNVNEIINRDLDNNPNGELTNLMGGNLDNELTELVSLLVKLERLSVLIINH
jgi:hypothetical protein